MPVGIYALSVYTQCTEYGHNEQFAFSFSTEQTELLQVSQLKIRWLSHFNSLFVVFPQEWRTVA